MKPIQRELANGLRLIALERPQARTALLNVGVALGSAYESPSDSGLSHFLEHMVFQGCARFPTPDAVNQAAERMGAALDASTGRESTHYEHWIDPSKVGESAALLANLLSTPRFEAIESEREIVLEEALDELDETGELVDADSLSRQDLWPKSGFGQRVIGDERNLRRFTVDDLKRHHEAYYHAGNMVVSVVVPGSAEAALDTISGAFESIAKGQRAARPEPGPNVEGPVTRLVSDGRSQCDVRLAFRTCGRTHEDALAISMLRTVLDDGMATRLHRRLGGELGLAYNQWAVWEPYRDTGAFEIGGQVSPGKLKTFVVESQRLMTELIDSPPEGDELEFVRFRVDWAIRCLFDSAEGLVSWFSSPALFDEPFETADALRARVAAFTPELLSAAASRLFDPKAAASCFVGGMDKGTRRGVKHATRRFRADMR